MKLTLTFIADSTIHQSVDTTYTADMVDHLSSIRRHAFEHALAAEKERTDALQAKVLAWVGDRDEGHEDDFERLAEICLPGTSEWFLEHHKVKSWMDEGSKCSKVWVRGKPGCGMFRTFERRQ